jgi:MFS family permease
MTTTSWRTAVSTLIEGGDLNLSAAEVGAIGAVTLVGMTVGAALTGQLLRLVSHRVLLVACLTWSSIPLVVAAFAWSALVLGLFRGLARVGLGRLLSVASALALDHAAPVRRPFVHGVTFSAYPLSGWPPGSGILAGALASSGGFRLVIAAGAVALLVGLIVMFLVPEDQSVASSPPTVEVPISRRGTDGALFGARAALSRPAVGCEFIHVQQKRRASLGVWIS